MSFVRGANPIWYLPDLVGEPLNDEYYAFFLYNTLPYLPQPVYQDNQGINAWSFPIEFLPNGTLPDNLYFPPTDINGNPSVYRIEIRHGSFQSDPLIYEINNYVPDNNAVNPFTPGGNITGNQVLNSQFSQVLFSSGTSPETLTITTAGTYQVAPGWKLVLSGAGTGTVTQRVLPANSQVINNPSYSLEFNLSGWTSAQLIQTFSQTGNIFSSNSDQTMGIAGSITAVAFVNPVPISMSYVPSDSGTPTTIIPSTVVGIDTYQQIEGAAIIPPSTDTDESNVAFVNIVIALPGTGDVAITNVQVVGEYLASSSSMPFTVPYQQQTFEQQQNALFGYYSDSILNHPKESLLAGWNFSLNPYQFVNPALATVSNQTQYIADQTILHQQTAASLQSGKASAANRFGLEIAALGAGSPVDNQFAIIQYIDPSVALPYWGYLLSSLVRAAIVTSHATLVGLKMRLIWRTTLPNTLSATDPIVSWTAGGDPVFATGWTAIEPLNDAVYTLNAANADSSFNSMAFDAFQLPTCQSATQTLAIVLYTDGNLNNTVASVDSIIFDKVSLVQNQFAIDTQPETFDEALRKCQFYYERSFDSGFTIVGGTYPDFNGTAFAEQLAQGTSPITFYAQAFGFEFNTVKRSASSIVTLYSPISGAAANVFGAYGNNGSWDIGGADISITAWAATPQKLGEKSAAYIPTTNNPNLLVQLAQANVGAQGYIYFHYTVNACLGNPTLP